MDSSKAYTRKSKIDQAGINMVDLMMWLVIAALLLAAAIQGIAYYQKASFVYQLQSDLSGAGSRVMSGVAQNSGVIDTAVVESGSADTKWSENVAHTVETSTDGSRVYIRATHPEVDDLAAIYLFEACGEYNVGVNVVPKEGNIALEDCGIASPAPGEDIGGDPVDFSNLTWTERTVTGSDWYDVASSADGKIAYAVRNGDGLYKSTDYGDTWSELFSSPSYHISAATTNDGSTVLFGQHGGYPILSNDGGTTKASAFNTHDYWDGATVSGDGTTMAVVAQGGYVWTSKDSGVTWNKTTLPSDSWFGIASSNDGTTMLAGAMPGEVWVSHDSGDTWTETSLPYGRWHRMDISSDGNKMIAVDYNNGYLHISNDSGATWTAQTDAGQDRWRGVSMSADGEKIIAVASVDSYIHTSTDGGETWTEHVDQGASNWRGASISDNGKYMIAVGGSGKIVTGVYGD